MAEESQYFMQILPPQRGNVLSYAEAGNLVEEAGRGFFGQMIKADITSEVSQMIRGSGM